ncbi:MAG: LysM peptidoglycan-binding domain-containing protein [Nitrospirae bacterium]|nr:LysM peptidoglycan-binding domain-containing protein [Nitrospirota bacterium]
MTTGRRRWMGVLALAGALLWAVPWIHPVGWSQEPPSAEEEPPPADESIADETAVPSDEILAPLEEAAPSPPETRVVPPPETSTHPRKYTIKEGDTLWGISNTYLQDYFLWPKLWKNNRQILNPDLIYPGNVIELPGEEPIQETEQLPPAAPPRMVEQPAPMEAEKTIEAELPKEAAAPSVIPLDKALLASSGYILSGQKPAGIVIGARDNRELIGQNETAYLMPQNGSRPQVGDRYTLYRVIRKVHHPKTGKYMGDLIRILGLAEVTGAKPDEKTVSAKVMVSYDYIQKGDPLMPAQPPEESSEDTAAASPSDNALMGFIVEVKEDRVSQAQLDVVYLDRGRQDGIRSGDRFTVVRDGEKTSFFSPGKGARLPSRMIGELQVIAVQDATATAKVIRSTEVIYKGDRFETGSGP